MSSTAIVFACSGPGSERIIAENISIGDYCAAFGVVMMLTIFALQQFRLGGWPLIISSALVVLHPAWTIDAIGGDCGELKRYSSYLVSILFVCLLLFQIVARLTKSQGEPP
jgi:hypothetical protein